MVRAAAIVAVRVVALVFVAFVAWSAGVGAYVVVTSFGAGSWPTW